MMNLDEAIEHALEKARKETGEGCRNEHAQLAAWLQELKELKTKQYEEETRKNKLLL